MTSMWVWTRRPHLYLADREDTVADDAHWDVCVVPGDDDFVDCVSRVATSANLNHVYSLAGVENMIRIHYAFA